MKVSLSKVSLSALLVQWLKANKVMLINAGSLIATTGITSVLGFAYWWLAARRFPPEAVGIASTSTSAMMLVGGLCTLGFSTLLLTEIPRKPELTGPLISTALLAVGATAGTASIAFAYIASAISPQYQPLHANITDVIILAIGIALSAMTLVFDQAMIGLLRGELQLSRNVLFAIIKVLGLFVVGFWLSRSDGMSIYAAWAFGSLVSMVVILAYAIYRGVLHVKELVPRISLLRNLGISAFQHHLLNTTLQAPMQILPLLVTALLSAHVTAWFFTAWQIANFVFLVPSSLTTVLHAMNSAHPEVLARKARSTIGLAVLVSVLVNSVLLFAPRLVLSPFGADYATHADWTLRILSFAAFPLIIKSHYISICRIQDRITPALRGMAPGSVLEIAAAALGAHIGGLAGLSLAWVLAVAFESLFMIKTVYMVVWPSEAALTTYEEHAATSQDIWAVDTIRKPALSLLTQSELGHTSLESVWLMETVTMPAITETMKMRRIKNMRVHEAPLQMEYSQPDANLLNDKMVKLPQKRGELLRNASPSLVRPSQFQQYMPIDKYAIEYRPAVPPTDIALTEGVSQDEKRNTLRWWEQADTIKLARINKENSARSEQQ